MVTIDPQAVRDAVAARLPDAKDLLCDLIAIPSLPGGESDVVDRAAVAFDDIADVHRVEMTNALRDDVDYSDPIPDIDYTGRSNLRVVLPGSGGALAEKTCC